GPDAADLVRGDARADAGPADEDSAIRFAVADRVADAGCEVRVVVLRIGAVATEIDDVVAETRGLEPAPELVLQGGPGVIGGECHAHLRDRSAVAGVGRRRPVDARVAVVERRMAAARRRQVTGLEGLERAANRARQHVPSDRDDPIDAEPELLEDRPGRRRRAEMVEPDDRAVVADPAVP